jgi:hypothetical protein
VNDYRDLAARNGFGMSYVDGARDRGFARWFAKGLERNGWMSSQWSVLVLGTAKIGSDDIASVIVGFCCCSMRFKESVSC